jgi:hypothetical protein
VPEEEPVVQGLLVKGWASATGARFRIASAPAVRITTARLLPAEADTVARDLADCLTRPWAGRTA